MIIQLFRLDYRMSADIEITRNINKQIQTIMDLILSAVLVLGAIALVAALVLSGYPRSLPLKKTLDWDR